MHQVPPLLPSPPQRGDTQVAGFRGTTGTHHTFLYHLCILKVVAIQCTTKIAPLVVYFFGIMPPSPVQNPALLHPSRGSKSLTSI